MTHANHYTAAIDPTHYLWGCRAVTPEQAQEWTIAECDRRADAAVGA